MYPPIGMSIVSPLVATSIISIVFIIVHYSVVVDMWQIRDWKDLSVPLRNEDVAYTWFVLYQDHLCKWPRPRSIAITKDIGSLASGIHGCKVTRSLCDSDG